ncbi:ferritin-like domain-containing protein [Hymenobacter properus]|uniref:Ferritin-like domain-containing protein n=1 Tax=Hymenobacter properus TaxID=2791026 RepID=A0A931FM86_9BACT|nr:ferritin-like domain-containing protein [Hymenobacter properus]MBF9142846.1 ferritin-like domain-containing protein [Hymenobacter properus]MBR7721655.1 ferritin-like domain-containing protein [Microvirga sp. SRT04]
MDLFQIIDDISKVDPEVYDRFDSRRAAFRNFLGFGKKVSAAALPLAVSTLFNKAYGQSAALPQAVIDTLNLALQLEYLEYFYYDTALSSSGLNLTAEETRAFQIIRNDEQLHINTLRSTLGSNAFRVLTRADFDYTGSQNKTRGALFPALGGTSTPTSGQFTDKAVFLTVAQNFVDTGVRAYKGGAPNLNPPNASTAVKDILEAALNIHSVEARHSSRIRSLRRGGVQSTALPKSWITPDETPATPPLPNGGTQAPNAVGPYNAGNPLANYPPESNVMQGVTPVNVQTVTTVASSTAGAEAFDEPLDAATVKAIAKNFAAVPTGTTGLFN